MSASDNIKAGQNTRQGREIARPPAQLSAHAIGREAKLGCLHAQLGKTRLPLVVRGVGGLGKTTFAQMYWQRHHAEYDHVVWLSAAADYTAADNRRADNAEYSSRDGQCFGQ